MGTISMPVISIITYGNIMFNEYEKLKKYSHIFQFNNSPICLHMGIFPYAYIWERSHMFVYWNKTIYQHMGMLQY